MNNVIKKPFFNVKLYLEGIRQLKIVGVMGAIIMAGAAFLIPMGNNISNANYEVYRNGQWIKTGDYIGTYDILEMNPLIVTTFLILTPLMVMILFNFLNRRNACDFYHAIPDTRTSLFVSYGGSVLTWNIAILLLSYIVTALSGAVFHYVQIDYSGTFVIFLNCIVGCLFMFGVFSIAISLTGTNFTNFSVAVMILSVPRIIVTVFVLMLTEYLDIIPFTFSNSILDDRLNTVTNLVTGAMVRGDYDAIFMWKSVMYTFIVGLLYCVIGLFLFRKRKSEVAASAAVNSKMQCVFRLIPAILISLLPLSIILEFVLQDYEVYGGEIFLIVVLYLIAILAYFIYELITTKKLRNCIKAIPGLLGLVAFNVLFFGLFFASYHVLLNDVPEVSDVKYVNINFDSHSGRYSFCTGKVKEVDITSEEIKALLVEELERNVNAIKANESVWSYDGYFSKNYYIEGTVEVLVEFHTGLGTKTRLVYVSPDKAEELFKLLQQNSQIVEKIFEPFSINDIVSFNCYQNIELTKEEVYDIYLKYMEELKEMDTEDAYYRLLIDYSSNNYDIAGFRLRIKDDKVFNILLGTDMPQTLNYYMNLLNSKSNINASAFLKECLANDIWKEESRYEQFYDHEISLELRVYPKQDAYRWFYLNGYASASGGNGDQEYSETQGELDLSDEEIRKVMYDVAKRLEGTDTITENKTGNILYILYAEEGNPKSESAGYLHKEYSRYCIIDDETMELLEKLY